MQLRDPADLEDDQTLAAGLRRLPDRMYRISGVTGPRLDWLRAVILESKLYFASPSEFNDPFDSKIPINHNAPSIDVDRYWRRAARRMHPGVPMPQLKRIVKKFVSESKRPLGRDRQTRSIHESLEQHGIACFTPDIEHPLVWAHYGEGHRGVAIRFETSRRNLGSIRPGGILPIEMKYQSQLPEVSFYYGTTAELITTILGTKAVEWSYEKEWQLVLPGTRGLVRVPAPMVDGVIFGMRVDPTVEATIRGWIAARSQPIELLRVANVPGSFKLTLVAA